MKKLLLLLYLLLTSLGSMAHDFEVGGIYYQITSSTAPLTVAVTYLGNDWNDYSNEYTGSVTIPESVTYSGKTYSVSSIGSYAFYNSSGLTSVTIPNSVTSIGYYAFRGCSGLTSVTIPNSVTSIGERAFYNCSGLTSVTIPESVTSIGNNAFYGCYFLQSSFINNSSLSNNNTWGATLCDEETSDGLLIINNVVVKCRPWATSITIPNGVTSIGEWAFYDCSGLTSVTIGNSVTSIGISAFAGCSGLTSVTIPESVTSIGQSAFARCI